MISRDLGANGMTDWYPFNVDALPGLLPAVPQKFGTYCIRQPMLSMAGKLKSDILYFGSATNEHGLRTRFRQYLRPGRSQHTAQRIHQLISERQDLYVAFVTFDRWSDAICLEARLIESFEESHGQKPPENLRR